MINMQDRADVIGRLLAESQYDPVSEGRCDLGHLAVMYGGPKDGEVMPILDLPTVFRYPAPRSLTFDRFDVDPLTVDMPVITYERGQARAALSHNLPWCQNEHQASDYNYRP